MVGKRAASKSLFVILISILLFSLSYKAQQVLGQSGSITTNNPAASNFLTYTNTNYGFTIKYPSDWIVEENKTGSTVAFRSPDHFGSVAVTKLTLGPNETGMSRDDLAKWFIRYFPATLLELNSNNYFLSGHPAIRAIGIISYETMPSQIKNMAFITTSGENGYFVFYTSALEKFPDYLQTAQTMIDSFQIISKVG
jgi:eukaryotic-like serine/threonine-protein kinase